MSNALCLIKRLPLGRQWKFDQSPHSNSHSGSRLVSLLTAASMLLGSLLGFSAVAVAEEEMVVEEVVVTGTRIKRPGLESSSPIVTIDSQEIDF